MNKNRAGFTIIELTLAMGFLTVLMFILLISSFQFISIFNKGITLKRVDQSGRNLGEELQNSLRHTNANQSAAVTVPTNPKTLDGQTFTTRACTGTYSYLWSVYGKAGNKLEKYDNGNFIGFAKVFDPDGLFCRDSTKHPAQDKATEFLADGLVIRLPTEFNFTDDGKLTSFTYTISTPDSGDLIFDGTGRSNCAGGDDRDFCALNTFTVTVYSKGI